MSDQSQLSAAVGSDAGRQRTRTISTFVDYAARSASWYTTDTSAPESLTSQPAGSFLVVDTSAQRGGDALPPAVHYVISMCLAEMDWMWSERKKAFKKFLTSLPSVL